MKKLTINRESGIIRFECGWDSESIILTKRYCFEKDCGNCVLGYSWESCGENCSWDVVLGGTVFLKDEQEKTGLWG